MWLLFISKSQLGAEMGKVSEYGIGQSKSGGNSQQDDQKILPEMLCTVEIFDGAVQRSSRTNIKYIKCQKQLVPNK